jgi:hypothetical protein
MADITFTYMPLEKGIQKLKFFFRGNDFIVNDKKRTDRLLSILEEMSWRETPVFEMLVMNTYTNQFITKDFVMSVLPDMTKDLV